MSFRIQNYFVKISQVKKLQIILLFEIAIELILINTNYIT